MKQRYQHILVVLEDIHDPHNAAAILRTCDAFGIQNVWFVFEQEKPYNPKKVGKASSSSANKWLSIQTFNSVSACIAALVQNRYTIIVSAISPQAIPLDTARFTEKKTALIVGNEHRGISEEMLAKADRVIQIPMRGFVQSLNVSVATAILLWEITKNGKLVPTKQRNNQSLKR